MARIETAVKAQLDQHIAARNSFCAGIDACEAEINGFFTQHRLARSHRHFNKIRMGFSCGGDQYSIHMTRGKYVLRARCCRYTVLFGHGRGAWHVDIIDHSQFSICVARDIICMHAPYPSTSQNRYVEHFFSPKITG